MTKGDNLILTTAKFEHPLKLSHLLLTCSNDAAQQLRTEGTNCAKV